MVASMSQAHSEALRRAWEQARTANPAVALKLEDFLEFMADRTALDADLGLEAFHLEDLFLACASLKGDRAALEELEARLRQVRPAVRAVDTSEAFADEVLQRVREACLLGTGAARPKLAAYAGRGPLLAWLRVSAVGCALNLRRERRPEVADEGLLSGIPADAEDPVLRALKARYQTDFKAAFEAAVGQLEPRDRTLLRMRFVDGLTLQEMGGIYRVTHVTAMRWLEQCRSKLMTQTRASLVARLGLSPSEADSLLKELQSGLELSLDGLLR